MNRWIVVVALLAFSQPATAAGLTPEAINAAEFSGKIPNEDKISPLAVKVQVLLDRAHFSPGEIDGRFGDNVEKALLAFAEANGLPPGKALTPEIWSKLTGEAAAPVIAPYTLTEQDLKGPFLDKLPAKMDDMKSLSRLDYTSPKEALSERFHISPDLLTALNPGQKFNRAGDVIHVVNVARAASETTKDTAPTQSKDAAKQSKKAATKSSANAGSPAKAARLEVDKDRQTVKAFAADGKLLAFYPASVGSEEKPTPTGTLKVVSVQATPHYRYDPKYQFRGVKSTEPFTIKPGPNNPVGAMWIGLSEKSYGIHGTAEPSRVSKTESHGCIRLTNWDVQRLGQLVKKGVEVVFVEPKQASK